MEPFGMLGGDVCVGCKIIRTSRVVRPSSQLALPKRTDFWIMDFVESSTTSQPKGVRGQPQLNLWKDIRISGKKSETRLDLSV